MTDVQRISRVQDVARASGVLVEALDTRFGTANHSSGSITREMAPLLLPFNRNEHDDYCRKVKMAIEDCAGLSILYCQDHCVKRLMLSVARIQR